MIQGLTKQYEKELNNEQREQLEVYKRELLDQIRSRRENQEDVRRKEKEEAGKFTGLNLGHYNPNFRDLLKQELERQIKENKEKKDSEARNNKNQDKERVKKQAEFSNRIQSDSMYDQASTKRKLKDLVKGDYDRAWNRRHQVRDIRTVDVDALDEPKAVTKRSGAEVYFEGHLKPPTREKLYNESHKVNRRGTAEEDYWFIKTLTENEKKIIEAEEGNKKRVQEALNVMLHEDLDDREKVILSDHLYDRNNEVVGRSQRASYNK